MEFSFPYHLRTQLIQVGPCQLELESLADLEQTIDDFFSEYQKSGNENLFEDLCPYFGVPWPAGLALGRLVAERVDELRGKKILELGCGLAIPSLVLGKLGINVSATDLHPDVPAFLQRNLTRNNIISVQFEAVDWRAKHPDLWDVIIASDVLYDKMQPQALFAFLQAQLAAEGKVILADPGRPYWEAFTKMLRDRDWNVEEELRDSVFFLRGSKASARGRLGFGARH